MTLSNMYGPARTLIDSDYHRIGSHLISPFDPQRVQPASYDVTLGRKILLPRSSTVALDLRDSSPGELMYEEEIKPSGYVLRPSSCALVATVEMVTCPPDMTCSVEGKSTLGRCFLAIHSTAGFIDPGFCGVVTLELTNHGPWAFVLYPGMKIGQLRFTWLGMAVARPYGSPGVGSHYQGSREVVAAAGPEAGRS